jgi:hypothetical protein
VADRFALLQSCAADVQGALLTAEDTKPPAVGTGLLLAQGVGLLLEEGLQGALGESVGGGAGDLLHGIEIDLKSGAAVAAGASGDDFAPLGGEAAEFLELLGGEGAVCHDASCLGVETRSGEESFPLRYDCELDAAKLFMTSTEARPWAYQPGIRLVQLV